MIVAEDVGQNDEGRLDARDAVDAHPCRDVRLQQQSFGGGQWFVEQPLRQCAARVLAAVGDQEPLSKGRPRQLRTRGCQPGQCLGVAEEGGERLPGLEADRVLVVLDTAPQAGKCSAPALGVVGRGNVFGIARGLALAEGAHGLLDEWVVVDQIHRHAELGQRRGQRVVQSLVHEGQAPRHAAFTALARAGEHVRQLLRDVLQVVVRDDHDPHVVQVAVVRVRSKQETGKARLAFDRHRRRLEPDHPVGIDERQLGHRPGQHDCRRGGWSGHLLVARGHVEFVAAARHAEGQHLARPVRLEPPRFEQTARVGEFDGVEHRDEAAQFRIARIAGPHARVDGEDHGNDAVGYASGCSHAAPLGRHRAGRIEAEDEHRTDERRVGVGRDLAQLVECAFTAKQ